MPESIKDEPFINAARFFVVWMADAWYNKVNINSKKISPKGA